MQKQKDTDKKLQEDNLDKLRNEIKNLENIINNQALYIEQLENSFSLRIGRKFGFLFKVKQYIYLKYRKLSSNKILKKIFNRKNSKYVILPKKVYDLSNKSNQTLKIASILDEFSYNCFKYEADFTQINNKNYISQLQELKPDLFFIESAWKGSNGQWKIGQQQNYIKLIEITNYCKKNNIPTIFWCKEDPVHFEHFIPVAKLFDYVFTTDANMINEYKKRCGHTDVYAMPFAAQPYIHNPIKEYEREEKVCFAGSYYRQKYQDRAQILRTMLNASQTVGLDIYDRNFNSGIEHYQFPDEYSDNVKGVLPYDQISKAYKGYKLNINVNTVTESPTMFSRRVFESLASNTPIISNYSKGVAEMFNDIVYMSEDEDGYSNHLNYLMNHRIDYEALALKGLRTVLSYHTYHKRMIDVLDKLSIQKESDKPQVLVIAQTENIQQVLKYFNNQRYQSKQLLIISDSEFETLNSDNIKLMGVKNIREIIDFIVDFDYVTLFNESYYYGEYYLTDLINTLLYRKADIIGKSFNVRYKDNSFIYHKEDEEYTTTNESCDLSASIIKCKLINEENILYYLENNMNQESLSKFKIDSFNIWTSTEDIDITLLDEHIQI